MATTTKKIEFGPSEVFLQKPDGTEEPLRGEVHSADIQLEERGSWFTNTRTGGLDFSCEVSVTPESRMALEWIAKKDAKRSRIPRTDIGIGETFFRKGREYVCVRRPRVSLPSEACSGCSFNTSDVKCIGLRCSSFDRSDRNNVWFEEVEK